MKPRCKLYSSSFTYDSSFTVQSSINQIVQTSQMIKAAFTGNNFTILAWTVAKMIGIFLLSSSIQTRGKHSISTIRSFLSPIQFKLKDAYASLSHFFGSIHWTFQNYSQPSFVQASSILALLLPFSNYIQFYFKHFYILTLCILSSFLANSLFGLSIIFLKKNEDLLLGDNKKH